MLFGDLTSKSLRPGKNALIIIALFEVWDNVRILNCTNLAIGQDSLDAIAGGDAHFAILSRHQEHHPIVLAFRAGFPGFGNLQRIVENSEGLRGFDSDNGDLCAGFFL